VENIAYFIFLLLYPPYFQKLHSIGLLINQLTILFWIGVAITTKVSRVSEDVKYLCASGIVIMLIVVDVLTALRIIYQLYRYGSQKTMIEKKLLIS
jgi:hypothetical protein